MSSRAKIVSGGPVGLLFGLLLVQSGCFRGDIAEVADGPSKDELVTFYSPRSIKIRPFTKPASFDDDAIPDGIIVFLEPADDDGDAVKAIGTFIFELYSYRSAAGDTRGERLQTWRQPVLNADQRRQFWNHVIRMYEFQLSWEGKPIPPQKKYVLTVSFQAPGSERLFDEYDFEFRVPRGEIMSASSERE